MDEYRVKLTKIEEISMADCVIVAVVHDRFKKLSLDDIRKLFRDGGDCKDNNEEDKYLILIEDY